VSGPNQVIGRRIGYPGQEGYVDEVIGDDCLIGAGQGHAQLTAGGLPAAGQ
jgi:hypothetical protein